MAKSKGLRNSSSRAIGRNNRGLRHFSQRGTPQWHPFCIITQAVTIAKRAVSHRALAVSLRESIKAMGNNDSYPKNRRVDALPWIVKRKEFQPAEIANLA